MIRHRYLSLLVVALALFVAAPVCAQGKKKSRKKKSKAKQVVGLDKDLENEIYVVLERGTRSADMETRATAVEYIARVRAGTVKDYVVDALKDPQWIVRHSAIKALIIIKDQAYRKTLGAAVANSTLYEKKALSPLKLVLTLPSEEAIQLLAEALVKVEDVRDIILKEIFKKDSHLAKQFYEGLREVPPVKEWVMSNLTIFADKNMYPILIRTLPSLDKDKLLKAFKFLEGLDDTYDVSFLKKYLKDKDWDIVEAAAFILAVRGDAAAVETILPMCDENDVHRQLRCLQAVRGAPTHPEVKERAKLFLYGDPDPEVLYAVYDIFTLAKDDSIYERMVKRLQSTNLGHRAAAVYFLGKLKGNRALPQLHDLLRDGSPLIRQRAAKAIGELQQADSIPALSDALRNDNDVAVKKELIQALGNIGERGIIDVVSFLIFDPSIRDEAVVALCSVRHRDAIGTLRNVLQTQFTKQQRTEALKSIIRISAAEGLTIFKGCLGWLPEGFMEEMAEELKGEFLAYLKAGMQSINERVRSEAVLAFKHMGVELELNVLEKQLFSSKDNRLRVLILTRLAQIKKETSLDLLKAFFKDENRGLRLASFRLVSKYARPGAAVVEPLRGMLLDPDETYRVAAAVALVNIYLGFL